MKTYECSICHEVNHVARLHCKSCGTIPARYSVLKTPARVVDRIDSTCYIAVLVAWGAERQDISRTSKRLLRTVPADYYATE